MVENTARLHGVLVAYRNSGTQQGQAGWYVRNNELFYFAVDKGEFVLLSGPFSAEEYDEALQDITVAGIPPKPAFAGEIEIDRLGLHANKMMLQRLKERVKVSASFFFYKGYVLIT